MGKIKVGVVALGCDKNRVDTEVMLGNIVKAGYEIVNQPEDADVIIVNTCAFIESARKEAVSNIFDMVEFKRADNSKKIIVTGCLTGLYKDELANELVEADAVLGIGEYDIIGEVIERVIGGERVVKFDCQRLNEGERVISTPPHYAYLKIADGCDNFCTYCTIPYIRGRYRSRTIENIVNEARGLVGEKGTELILVAQDVTKYGFDIYGELKIRDLIRELSNIEGITIRLLYCYPELITDELIEEIKINDKVVKYIDIPMQHATDNVLTAMNRRSTNKELRVLIEKIKREIPSIALRSTFIVGFPGETDEDFNELCDFLKFAKFANAGFFTYSREEGTVAGNMQNQIDEEVKAERYEKAYLVQQEVIKEYYKNYIGKKLNVVVEDKERGNFIGRSYINAPEIDGKVVFTSNCQHKEGDKVVVEINEFKNYDLFGKVVEE